MSGRGNERSEPMKVVFINTQYVETDARSFKTVVQQLTGKDATVAAGPNESVATGNNSNNNTAQFSGGGHGGGGGGTGQLGRFFNEMPPVDELYKLWSDN